jgi:diacylglycerol kinase family enzyme
VVNPGSGDGDPSDLVTRARHTLADVRVVELSEDVDLGAEVEAAVGEDRTVVAAGGDGTVNAVAQHLVGGGVLGVLPGGTLNHFARDLGVRDLEGAFEVLSSGREIEIDVGVAGDRYFLNNAGLGLYPELVYEREQLEDRIGTWMASARAAVRVMREARPLAGRVTADGEPKALLAWMVFVGNNRFGTAPGRIARRERLDEGVLDLGIFLAGAGGARRSQVAWRMLRSRPWQTSRRVVRRDAERVEVELRGEPRLVSFDGESGDQVRTLDLRIRPRALRVLAPPEG